MLADDFDGRSVGEMRPPVGSGGGITHGFVPAPLPPSWTWPDELWPLLLEAHKALAKLDGIGGTCPARS